MLPIKHEGIDQDVRNLEQKIEFDATVRSKNLYNREMMLQVQKDRLNNLKSEYLDYKKQECTTNTTPVPISLTRRINQGEIFLNTFGDCKCKVRKSDSRDGIKSSSKLDIYKSNSGKPKSQNSSDNNTFLFDKYLKTKQNFLKDGEKNIIREQTPKHKRIWLSKNILYDYTKKTYGSYFGEHETIINEILQEKKELYRKCGLTKKPINRVVDREIRIMDYVLPLNETFLNCGVDEQKLVFNFNCFLLHKKILTAKFVAKKEEYV